MSEWQTMDTAPEDSWFLAFGPFDSVEGPGSIRIVRKTSPNGRGGQYGEFIWAEPGAPSVGMWAESIPQLWMPLPAKPELREAANPKGVSQP